MIQEVRVMAKPDITDSRGENALREYRRRTPDFWPKNSWPRECSRFLR